jgi:hypothetical protein
MSANPLELFSFYGYPCNHAAVAGARDPDRRRKPRTRLHWPVVLFRAQGAEAIESLTRDLSSCGFSFSAPLLFRIGEILNCSMKIPTHDPNGRLLERNLECRVRVVRARSEEEGGFEVACLIEDYHFAPHVSDIAG